MHLHNYLVDYRIANNNVGNTDQDLFNEIVSDIGAEPLQVGSDLGRPSGRITTEERSSRNLGLYIRNKLTLSLREHSKHRPCSQEWFEDNNTHMQRV